MSDARLRAQQTVEQTRRGGLPAPADAPPTVGAGDDTLCRGCGEAIASDERMYTVNLLGALIFNFHSECYTAWKAFRPDQARRA